MTLEQLRIFVAVAERRHFTRAAEDLRLTQSAVSAAVAALESRYGVPLFDRIGRRVDLTRAGLLLLGEARAVLRRAEDAVKLLNDLSDMVSGEIRLFGSDTVAKYWLPPLLHRFRAAHPGIGLSLAIGNTEQAIAALTAGGCDLACVEGTVEDETLIAAEVPGDRLVMVVGRAHPWYGAAAVSPERLRETPWVLRERGSGTRRIFEDCLRRHDADPAALSIALELPSGEAVKTAVLAGAGAAVISDLIVRHEIALGLLHALPVPCEPRRFRLLHHPARHRTRAVEALVAMARGSP